MKRKALFVVALFAAGIAIYGSTLASDRLAVPAEWEPVVRGIYRLAFFARLPAMASLQLVYPIEGHHYHQPAVYELLTSFGAPLFWGLAILSLVAARRLARKADSKSVAGIEIPRRVFLIGAAGAIGSTGSLGSYSTLVEPQRLRVVRYRMAIRDLPAAFEGFRIVHVSDTHYGPFISMPYLRGAIEQANALQGDVVLLTGDYVHKTPLSIGPGVDVLKHLRARLGAVATLGNHDHWEGVEEVRAAFGEIGLPLIDNARRFLACDGWTDEPVPGESICVAGLGDLWEGEPNLARALEGVPAAMPRLVLAHNPDTAEEIAPGVRVDAMFSGHTHGGQVWVPGLGTPLLPSRYGQKYAGGVCVGPSCPVVVSRGVGMAMLPVRFGVPPEIGEITLVRT